jgi:hypothetical protein
VDRSAIFRTAPSKLPILLIAFPGVSEYSGAFRTSHTPNEFMRETVDRIGPESKCADPLEGQRDAEAIPRLVLSRMFGRCDSVDDTPEPVPSSGSIGIGDVQKEIPDVVKMIVPASNHSLDIILINATFHSLEPPLLYELFDRTRQRIAKIQVA